MFFFDTRHVQPYLCPACKPLLPTTYRSRHSPVYSHYYSKHHRGPRLDLTNDSFAVLLTLLTRLALFLSSRNTHLSSRRTFHAPQLRIPHNALCLRSKLTTPENTITYHNALVCHPKILHKHYFSFSWELKWPQEKLKTMVMQNFGLTNKEHYGMLWYFLEWSILCKLLFSIAHGNMLTSQGNRKHYDQTPLIRTLRGS